MTNAHHNQCQNKIIEHVKKHKNYVQNINMLENKSKYNFRDEIKLKYLTQFIIKMSNAGENTTLNLAKLNEYFDESFMEDDIEKYIQHVIKSFFVAEIFNTLVNKKYNKILKILQKEHKIMSVIIYKLYQIKHDEPITNNWKGFKYYFNNIVNMPFILFEQGIPINHFHTLHNFLGKHSEFNALVHGNPMASHGLAYESIMNIQELYANI